MAQLVRDVMTPNPVVLLATASLVEAALAMRDFDIGAVIVIDNNQVCGILTDRDIVVRAITSGPDTRLRAALGGFPVAGLTGTLGDRYVDDSSAEGAGLVRAKTGTLNTVIALSGYVVDADGRLLVFSFIGNELRPGAAGNKPALDASATVLAACGCS